MSIPVAWADGYPSKTINLVVPFSAGSGTDLIARGIANFIGTEWPTATVVVLNRPGANGFLGAEAVATAAADGYSILITTQTTQAAAPFLFKHLPFDPVNDFAPLTALASGSLFVMVPAASPIKSIPDLIAHARADKLTFGAGNSSSRVAGEMFKQMAGVDMTYIPYKSNPPAVTALISGEIDVMFGDPATALAHVKSGRLRALAYTGHVRSPILPAVPTMAEAGLKGFDLSYWIAAYTTHGTPPDVVRRLHDMLVKANASEVVRGVYKQSLLDPFTTTPDELAEFQRAETQKWGQIIRAANIVPE